MRYLFICLVAVLALSGCKNEDYNLRSKVPQKILAVADWHIDTLRHGDMKANRKHLSAVMTTKPVRLSLEKLSQALQSKDLLSMSEYEVVFYEAHGTDDGTRHNLTYQLQYKGFWLLVHMSIEELGEWRGVIKTTYQPIYRPIQELNAFNFENKSLRHYVVFTVFLLFIGITGWALWRWAKNPMGWKWKVFWFFVIFASFGRYIFDWNYNRYAVQWVTVRGAPVSVNKRANNGWWYFSLSLPVGAVVFLSLDRKWRRAREEEGEVPPSNLSS